MRPEDVRLQVALLGEPVTTVRADMRPLPSVFQHVLAQTAFLVEALFASGAGERLLSSVDPHVSFQLGRLGKRFVTH